VFFDGILISSKTKRLHHVDIILQVLQERQLYAKPSKCAFGLEAVYL